MHSIFRINIILIGLMIIFFTKKNTIEASPIGEKIASIKATFTFLDRLFPHFLYANADKVSVDKEESFGILEFTKLPLENILKRETAENKKIPLDSQLAVQLAYHLLRNTTHYKLIAGDCPVSAVAEICKNTKIGCIRPEDEEAWDFMKANSVTNKCHLLIEDKENWAGINLKNRSPCSRPLEDWKAEAKETLMDIAKTLKACSRDQNDLIKADKLLSLGYAGKLDNWSFEHVNSSPLEDLQKPMILLKEKKRCWPEEQAKLEKNRKREFAKAKRLKKKMEQAFYARKRKIEKQKEYESIETNQECLSVTAMETANVPENLDNSSLEFTRGWIPRPIGKIQDSRSKVQGPRSKIQDPRRIKNAPEKDRLFPGLFYNQ